MNYKDYNDFELLSYINENNEEANEIMYKKYEPLINSVACSLYRKCPNLGIEINDLIQEGMLGLNKAIGDFNDTKDAIFYTYAYKCIKTTIISYIVKLSRQKHKVLNESISLEITDEEGIRENNIVLEDNRLNPETLLISDEKEKEIINIAQKVLTPLELEVFELKLGNLDYKEIARKLAKDPKAIDNALQRI